MKGGRFRRSRNSPFDFMNTKNNSQPMDQRLNQIKLVSRVSKFIALGFLTFLVGVWLTVVFSNLPNPSVLFGFSKVSYQVVIQSHDEWAFWRFGLGFCFQAALGLWYWKLSRLFRFYEQGMIFSVEPISCIKMLGALFCVGGVLNTALQMLPPPAPQTLPTGVTMGPIHVYHLNFFQCDFGTGIDFGLLLAGATIVLIAWIMDEGRKIQEEQELTI